MDLPTPAAAAAPPPAPDSWELADLDAATTRLLVSPPPRKNTPSDEDFGDEPPLAAPAASSSLATSGGDRGGGLPEDALSQVDQFLREALEKPRERLSILRMEQDIERFIRDPTRQELEFRALPTSYLRLAAHRVAQRYCLQSVAVPDNILPDGSGSRIVIHKTSYCRFPPIRLADVPVNLPQEDSSSAVKFAIKQRPHKHPQTANNVNMQSSKANHQRSVEERKEEYNRARARIFSNNSSGGTMTKSEDELSLPDSFPLCSPVSAKSEEKSVIEGPEINYGRNSGESSRSGRNRTDREPMTSRYKANNRVAIFRDREVDLKDPDYDRSYERYTQRFDLGFGFNGGPYNFQAMYSPAVNYNTEFPQLGSGPRPQISLEHQPCPIPQHIRGPWSLASAPSVIGYGPLEGTMPSFTPTPNHVGAHQTSTVYLHSQYSVPPPAGIPYGHPHEHIQPFTQQQHGPLLAEFSDEARDLVPQTLLL